nr:hypothetical protein [Achromobacter insuavis]
MAVCGGGQYGTLARTGNTALDQEMYAAGLEKGEEKTKHNAAIRAGVPEGWKLVTKKTCYALMHDGAVIATLAGPESQANAAIIARMLAAPSCPTCNDQGAVGNILTAEPCPACAANGVSRVEADAVKRLRDAIEGECGGTWISEKQAIAVLAQLGRSAPAAGDALTAAARDVLAERQRQRQQEGWTDERDDEYDLGELASAAAAYARYAALQTATDDPHPLRRPLVDLWPWDAAWWKPGAARRNLEKAGALVLAEIERLDRAAQRKVGA